MNSNFYFRTFHFDLKGDATDIRYQVLVNCDLQMVGEEFSRKPYAVAVQEGSPLRDLLNDAILRLLNQRRLETLKERWWTDNPAKQECGDTNDQSDGISIQNIGPLDCFHFSKLSNRLNTSKSFWFGGFYRWCLYRHFRRYLFSLRHFGG